ncbi:MAG TPA: hypothetical protein VLY03_05435 [Bacteroidota bacterium]|nr:hypothetical protein [Bacteroidota bacterium]
MNDQREPAFRRSEVLFLGIAAIALLAGIFHAFALSFVTDDAFISFRYAKNFVHGLGLVYNPGERVEGFTNFLWTIMMAGVLRLGFDPVSVSQILGIFFFGCTLLTATVLSWRLWHGAGTTGLALPLTAAALALHHDACVFATGGLETSFFTFLVSLLFVFVALWRTRNGVLLAGVVAVLLMMTRPDGIVYVVPSAVFLLLTSERPVRACSFFTLPILVLFVPYWIWRATYYGYFFPNSFYAKSIGLAYYQQGIAYTFSYFSSYYVFGAIVLLAIYLSADRNKSGTMISRIAQLRERAGLLTINGRTGLLASLFIIFQIAFVIRIGGDFMFGRFFVPVTPMLFMLCEVLVIALRPDLLRISVAMLILAGTYFRIDHFTQEKTVGYIADERQWYTDDYKLWAIRSGDSLKKYFSGLNVRVALWGGTARLGYYLDSIYVIEAQGGLTDAALSHQDLSERGRPGHEKTATLEFLAAKNVNFLIGPMNTVHDVKVLDDIVLDEVNGRIVRYDNSIMKRLEQFPEVRFFDFPRSLDAYIAKIDSFPIARVKSDYENFKSYYFEPSRDTVREQRFLQRLNPERGR